MISQTGKETDMKKALIVIFCGLLGLLVGCENLVFVREDSGTRHVYKMTYNGGLQIPFSPITGTPYDYPDISPDGTKIAYTDGQNVFLSDLNDMGGSSQQQLSTPSGTKTHVRWAPQQQVVGYANSAGGTASIFLSATSGVNFLQVTYPTGSQSDGGGLDFYLSNNIQYMIYSRNGDLYSMYYNGTQPPVQITNTPGASISETLPVVAHDGRLLAFCVSYMLAPLGTIDYIQIVEVGTWAPQHAIIMQPPVAKGTISSIAFSCDDQRLYVAAKTSSAAGSREIFSVKLDGSDQQRLTDNSVYDSKPDAIPKPCP
jgi:Tol biopolymer transport system component